MATTYSHVPSRPTSPTPSSSTSTSSTNTNLSSDLPWYRRPRPLWVLPITTLYAITFVAVVPARLEILNLLVCQQIRNDERERSALLSSSFDGQDDFFFAGDLSITASPFEGCRKDKRVQSKVAQFNMALTLTAGALSICTTGLWGRYSDRRGRKPVMAWTMFAGFAQLGSFILVLYLNKYLSYQWLIISSIVNGVCGSIPLFMSIFMSYVSDCTPSGSKAHYFSILVGCIFGGMGLGPLLGNALILSTKKVSVPFHVSIITHFTLAIICLFIPESLSKKKQASAQASYEASRKTVINKVSSSSSSSALSLYFRKIAFIANFVLNTFQESIKPVKSLAPLPKYINGFPVGSWRQRWSLTLLSLSYAVLMLLVPLITVEFLYAQASFNYGPIEIGFVISLSGGTKMAFLILFLPATLWVMRWYTGNLSKARPKLDNVDSNYTSLSSQLDESSRLYEPDETDPLLTDRDQQALFSSAVHEEQSISADKSITTLHFEAKLDLTLARLSLIVDAIACLLIAIPPRSSAKFLFACALRSLAGGGSPAMHSLCLVFAKQMKEKVEKLSANADNYGGNNLNQSSSTAAAAAAAAEDDDEDEQGEHDYDNSTGNGTILAGLAVVGAVTSEIIGPALFNTIWAISVTNGQEECMFWVTLVFIIFGIACLLLIRVDHGRV